MDRKLAENAARSVLTENTVEADHCNTHLLSKPVVCAAIKTQIREHTKFSIIASEYQKLTGYSKFSIFRKTMPTAVASTTKFSMTRIDLHVYRVP